MSATLPSSSPPAAATGRRRDIYRAVWRWHFYAGLLVLPFLAWLAITGSLFLFHEEIDDWWHRDLLRVAPPPAAALAAGAPRPLHAELVQAALTHQPGRVFKYLPPADARRSAQVGIATADGSRRVVYVDPSDARVLGSLADKGTLGGTIRQLHSLAVAGTAGQALIEIAAGWSILLVLTGLYLWWPGRRPAAGAQAAGTARQGGALSVRGRPRQRVFWRDLHAVLGLAAGGFVLFLAATGMPWSVWWGAKANQLANGHNYGYPAGVRVNLPVSGERLDAAAPTTWSLEQARVPLSPSAVPAGHGPRHGEHTEQAAHDEHAGPAGPRADPGADRVAGAGTGAGDVDGVDGGEHAGHGGGGAAPPPLSPEAAARLPAPLTLDQAIAIFESRGIAPGYTVNPPASARGVYTASIYPRALRQQRVIHIDQYGGQPLIDMSYADYGPLGRALEWGVNVHLGYQFGLLNQLVLLAACLAIVALCASAAVMWWKRRPPGRLGVPPAPADPRTLRGVTALLAIGGLCFPLAGASMAAIWAVDRFWPRGPAR